jgi:hypothetical protein
VIFSAPEFTRAAQLDGRAQRAQDAPPRVRRLCAITRAWLHRGDASKVLRAAIPREQPKTAPPAVYCTRQAANRKPRQPRELTGLGIQAGRQSWERLTAGGYSAPAEPSRQAMG